MTVQSDQKAAFDETMITLLQNIADQVAIVIENARLFSQTQAALARARKSQQRYQGQAWRDYMAARAFDGLEINDGNVEKLHSDILLEVLQTLNTGHPEVDEDGVLTVPVIQAGQVVGILGFDKPEEGEWRKEQISLIQELAGQLSLAAENQRLLDETKIRASREQLTREITEQIRTSLDVNTILKTAVREIGQVMDLDDLIIDLNEIASLKGT
jgi:GAF domain-containing protein